MLSFVFASASAFGAGVSCRGFFAFGGHVFVDFVPVAVSPMTSPVMRDAMGGLGDT